MTFELRTHPGAPPLNAAVWQPRLWHKGAVVWRADRKELFVALADTTDQPPSRAWKPLTKGQPRPRPPVDRAKREAHRARVAAEKEAAERKAIERANRELQKRLARGEPVITTGFKHEEL
jgi:hypothetical protein